MDFNPLDHNWVNYFRNILEKVTAREHEHCTHFADPRQQEIAMQLSHSFPGCGILFWGGFPAAERVRILVFPRSRPPREEKHVTPIMISGEFVAGALSHRDFLGAILGLGIKREMVGDILCLETGTLTFLVPDLAPFVMQELKHVGQYPVTAVIPEKVPPVFQTAKNGAREVYGTVASLRLDAVAGLGFGLSRSRITPLVRGEQVRLNHQVVNQPSRLVKAGDLISLTGRGRVEVVQILGETRKKRISLKLNRLT